MIFGDTGEVTPSCQGQGVRIRVSEQLGRVMESRYLNLGALPRMALIPPSFFTFRSSRKLCIAKVRCSPSSFIRGYSALCEPSKGARPVFTIFVGTVELLEARRVASMVQGSGL